ncbi:uncharacterized protein TEOVI_000862600 [Trypanosoma equiperdum]|uniref:Uncharacterized protein n=1 Tax=Trypanosoma equiperdum TaxID=5694 RepID=A0A1G4IL01_TRYEQ|nr:hypothetical protein TEOVI_000862600 [Trypanosoma equiperdum]
MNEMKSGWASAVSMRIHQQTPTAIGLLISICVLKWRTEAFNTGSKAVKTFRTEITYAQAILQQLSQWKITSATAAKEQEEEQTLLKLSAARYANTAEVPGYQALAALARQIAQNTAAEAQRAAENIDAAQTLLSARAPELSIVEALRQADITAGTSGSRTDSELGVLAGGQGQHCTSSGSITLADTVDCSTEESGMNTAKQVESELNQLQTLKIRTPANLRTVTINIVWK